MKFLLRDAQEDGPLGCDDIWILVVQVIVIVCSLHLGCARELGDEVADRRSVLEVDGDRAYSGDAQGLEVGHDGVLGQVDAGLASGVIKRGRGGRHRSKLRND